MPSGIRPVMSQKVLDWAWNTGVLNIVVNVIWAAVNRQQQVGDLAGK